jgi:hypothetical protein
MIVGKFQGVFQHRPSQGFGTVGAQDFTPESFLNQLRHAPNVINMGMGKKQKLNVRGFHRPSGYGKRFIRALRDTAIYQDIQLQV